VSRIKPASDEAAGRRASLYDRARHTRDRASLAVFGVSAFAVGSSTAAALHHWSVIGVGQARALGFVVGVAGGLAVLKMVGRVLPWIFRATHWERR
jgi:hypothetical protein